MTDTSYVSTGRVPTERQLRQKDLLGALLATLMTLGPLAATALFAH